MTRGDNSSCKVICPCLCFPALSQICQGLCATLVNVTQLSEFPFISSNFLPFPTTGQFTIQHLLNKLLLSVRQPMQPFPLKPFPQSAKATGRKSRKTNVLPYP